MLGSVVVRCSQTGKQHNVKFRTLQKDSGDPITEDNLKKGSSLVMEFKGKPYPVEFKKKCRCVHYILAILNSNMYLLTDKKTLKGKVGDN